MKLSIITVHYGDTGPLIKTLENIDSQVEANVESLVIASGMSTSDELLVRKSFSSRNRTFVINKDKSLYDAMNIGLNTASGNAVIFMNSGDSFWKTCSCSLILDCYNPGRCSIFRTAQIYEDILFVRPKLKKLHLLKKSPGHQGFVAPLPEAKDFRFNGDLYPVGADSRWMSNLINEYGCDLHDDIISEFELGGLSNLPKLNLAKLKFKEDGFASFMKVLVKVALVNFLGPRKFYKSIYFFKYEIRSIK